MIEVKFKYKTRDFTLSRCGERNASMLTLNISSTRATYKFIRNFIAQVKIADVLKAADKAIEEELGCIKSRSTCFVEAMHYNSKIDIMEIKL